MLRKGILVLAALLLGPALVSAYTIVLKDGRQIEARRPYIALGDSVWYVGMDGNSYRLAVEQVDFKATRQANAAQRKVWTNEDLAALRGAPVSVVGSGRASTSGAATGGAATGGAAEEPAAAEGGESELGEPLPPQEDTTEFWQEKAKALYEEIDRIDQQLERLQTGQNQAASNAVSIRDDAAGVDVRDTIQRLEQRKQALQEQIRQVEQDAKRRGIPPGKLRRSAVMKPQRP